MGRPANLDDEQRRALIEQLAESPAEHGIDAVEWTPEIAREDIQGAFGVEYSLGHVRRLLREAETDASRDG